RLHDVRTGARLADLSPGTTAVSFGAAFAPDGGIMACGCIDNTVRLWEAASGKERLKLSGLPDRSAFVAYSPDGKTLAATAQRRIFSWDASTGKALGEIAEGERFAFSPDGKLLATAGGATIRLWRTDTGAELPTTGHADTVNCTTLSADG